MCLSSWRFEGKHELRWQRKYSTRVSFFAPKPKKNICLFFISDFLTWKFFVYFWSFQQSKSSAPRINLLINSQIRSKLFFLPNTPEWILFWKYDGHFKKKDCQQNRLEGVDDKQIRDVDSQSFSIDCIIVSETNFWLSSSSKKILTVKTPI